MNETLKVIKKRIDGLRPATIARSKPELVQQIIAETSFLPDDSPLKRRMWHIANDILHVPECLVCEEAPIYFRTRTCSYIDVCIKCHKKREQSNRERANLEKYGVKTTLRESKFLEQGKATIAKKYGVENVSQSPDVRKKILETVTERFGTDNPSKSEEIKQKKKHTSLVRYGTENPLQHEPIKEQIRKTNLEKYGTESAAQSPEVRAKIESTNIIRYGGPNPSNSPSVRKKAEATMLEKYGNASYSQSHISKDSLAVLNNAEYLKELNSRMSATEIATTIGVSQSTVLNYINLHGLVPSSFNTSQAEREIRQLFSKYECVFNARKVINGELDIYIPELKLAIEYNGLYWHSEANGKSNNYHYDKYRQCREKGIRLISILESEWNERKNLVVEKLKHISNCSEQRRIYARKCRVRVVSSKMKSGFMDANHIQGNGGSTVNYALFHEGNMVACIAILKEKGKYIINRYATSCSVVGGFTKLLRAFEVDYNLPTIYTFADLRWSEGRLYIKSGFIKAKTLSPDYYWVKGGKAWHKFNWRHGTGLKTLPHYDRDKSESENMRTHGFSKLWDCGKILFVKNAVDI